MSSATPAIIVYAQELMPHRFGMISGLFFGMAFGFGGIGAAVLGHRRGLEGHRPSSIRSAPWLPAIGLLACFCRT
jgi:FSR family fosmidomycin resistance protein-like MFS transporter